jgi:serine/threonine protein kinase
MDDIGMAMIIVGVVHGMKFLYSSGVTHRDLKPANILLEEGGWPRIGNLNKSRFVNLEIMQTMQVGTPMYMAPETYDDEYTTAADVYSFALILYEVLVGCPVFDRNESWQRYVSGGRRIRIHNNVHQLSILDPIQTPTFAIPH